MTARASLYAAGITSPDMLAGFIDYSSGKADPAPRLTPSMRRRPWKRVACVIAALVTYVYLYGVPA